MILGAFYILFLGLTDLIIYSLLNKKGWFSPLFLRVFFVVFLGVIILQTGLINIPFLMKWKDFLPLLILLIVPVLVHFWFNYWVIKRINSLNIKNEKFLNFALKLFSFFFLKAFYLIAFVCQCIFILNPISSLQ